MAYSVLVVEDQEPIAVRFMQVIAAHPELELFGVATTVAQGRAMLGRGEPDVMLVDLGLPDGDGTQLIREIHERQYATEAMVITMFGDERHVVSALAAGAKGYLLKDEHMGCIGESIMQLIAGGSPISPSIARQLLNRFASNEKLCKPAPAVGARLTEKEHAVLQYIAKGFSNVEIADLIGVSPHTVTTHTKHIYEKLAVHSRTEAVHEAIQRGIIAWNR